MNCQQITSFIVEAARGQMLDAASREGALRHAESCQACGARLAQEQSLTDALRAVALGTKDLCAPARVEAKLLAAFQASLAQRNAPAATDSTPHAPVSLPARAAVAPHASNRRMRRLAFAATAIAASLVLVVLASLYLRFTRTAPLSGDVATKSQPTVSKIVTDAAPTGTTLTVATPLASASEPERPSRRATTGTIQSRIRSSGSQRATVKPARPHTPMMINAQHVIDGGNAIIEASEGETAAGGASRPNATESVTEFISLVADASAGTPLESGQLVRVQVPRAALASLGLPSNVERGNEPVKADVLLGGDGLARAIRFVR